MSDYAALVAIDWADQQHAVCLLDQSTGEREPAIVKHTPAALQERALSLRQRFAGQPIEVIGIKITSVQQERLFNFISKRVH